MKTRRFCRHCGSSLRRSRTKGYAFQCYACDEDFYKIEVLRKKDLKHVRELRKAMSEITSKEFPTNLFHPNIECTDPDTLQFCIRLSETSFWYCEFDQTALCELETECYEELYNKYEGYPEQLIADAMSNPEVLEFVNNKSLWISTTIDIEDIDAEEHTSLFDTYGMNPSDFKTPQELNQILAEMYFEIYIEDFKQ